jgi:hypothetical protein
VLFGVVVYFHTLNGRALEGQQLNIGRDNGYDELGREWIH